MSDRILQLPADEDGFITRECPTCVGTFKAPVIESSVTVHFCPYCGHEGDDCWWTPDQLDFIHKSAAEAFRPQLESFKKEIESHGGGLLKFKVDLSPAEPPIQPHEPSNTMDVVQFPCCGARAKVERIRLKRPDGTEADSYCIMCGTPGRLGKSS